MNKIDTIATTVQNLREGMPEITEKLAFDFVLQTSKELSPAFRWLRLSDGEPAARPLTKQQSLRHPPPAPAHIRPTLP